MSGRLLKYNEVKEKLKADLANLSPGEGLPNRNALALRYGVARTTLERAISELIGEGVLVSRDGSGTYAAQCAPSAPSAPPPATASLWAILVSNILYDIYPPIVRGVEDFTNAHGINLVICNTDNENDKQDDYLRKLLDSGVSGVIVVPAISGALNTALLEELLRRGVSVVACVRPLGSYLTPGVYINSFQAGFMAVSHLIERGCRHIAYLSAPLYTSSYDRYQGYLAAHDERGIAHDPALIAFGHDLHDESLGEGAAYELLRTHPEVDGVFAFNDRVACGVVAAMERLRLVPGRDIRLIGCDNTDICQSMPVKLSSIGFHASEVGEQSAQMLYSLQRGVVPAQLHAVVGTTLFVRETS